MKRINYVEPSDEEVDPKEDTSDLFINKLGYEITTTDKEIRAKSVNIKMNYMKMLSIIILKMHLISVYILSIQRVTMSELTRRMT